VFKAPKNEISTKIKNLFRTTLLISEVFVSFLYYILKRKKKQKFGWKKFALLFISH